MRFVPLGSLAALALALSAPALAQGYNRTDIVRGLCQPEGCDEFSVLGADQIAATEEGTLLRTRLKTFHASRDGRKDLGEESGFVFCSTTRPAIMANQDGRTMAFFIAPFATAESRETVRRNANYHAVYFAICHGPEAGQAAVRDLPGLARSLGYRVPDAQSRIVALARAEDVLGAGGNRLADVRAPDVRTPVERLPAERLPAGRLPDERLRPPGTVPLEEARGDLYVGEAIDDYPGRRLPSRTAPPPAVTYEDEGLFAGPRRFTNRTLDALDNLGDWVLGRH
jgi:hypothetical protein